jgi:hypothetical protein
MRDNELAPAVSLRSLPGMRAAIAGGPPSGPPWRGVDHLAGRDVLRGEG